jgi:3-(3-hydroxy-phenyl)propionate hydroxylase
MTGGERYDVVVIGAGPTGLVLANLLGREGVRVALVERNASTVDEARAVSIDDESLRTLQSIGLAEAALANIESSYGSVYVGPDGREFLRVQPTRAEYGWPKRSAFRQPLLEATLREGLARHASVVPLFRHTLASVDQDEHVVRARVTGPDGVERTLVADWLVGADGGRSTVRGIIGAKMEGSSFNEHWLVVDLAGTNDPFRETRVVCETRKPYLSLPGPHRTRRYEVRIAPDEDRATAADEANVRAFLRTAGPDAECRIDRRIVYSFHALIANRWRVGRVFLAGDAAHLTPPFAGQGMNAGLRDASNLGWKLAAVLAGRLDARLLDTYESERRKHAWSMIELALTMGKVMAPHSDVVAALTRVVFRAVSRWPAARDWLAQMRFKPKPRFDAGFLAGRDPERIGAMFPQPLVIRTGLPTVPAPVKLDEVLGPGFAVIAWDREPLALLEALGAERLARWGARGVAMLPRTHGFANVGEGVVLRDLEGVIGQAVGGREGTLVLLRPDRYVAGIADVAGMRAILDDLAGRFGLASVPATTASAARAA